MTEHRRIVMFDARGVCKGYAVTAPWPEAYSDDPAPSVFHTGVLYLRVDKWETRGGHRWRVYQAAPQVQPVEVRD